MSKIRAMSRVLLAALLLAAATANQDMTMGMSKVKILAKSGEIQFQRMLGNTSMLTDPVKIVMEKVVQMTAAGQEVATSTCSGTSLPFGGSMLNPMNMFKTFADKTFTIAAKQAGQYIPNANNIKGSMISFSANLGDAVGTLSISATLAEQAGEVLIAGEKQPLKMGDMKFNMELSKWKWCGAAGAANAAAFLDLYMKVTSKVAATLKGSASDTAAPVAFDLGDNITMSFSKKLKKDKGSWENMTAGYPKMDGDLFVLRFPRFTNTIDYDPTVAGDEDDDDASGDARSGDASGFKLSVVVTALAAVVAYVAL